MAIHKDEWEGFARRLFYVMGSLEEADIKALKHKLEELEAFDREPANWLFYFSISPRLYEATFTNKKATGIAHKVAG